MVNCCKLSYFQQLQNFNVAHRCRWCVIGLYLFKLNNRKMQNVFKVNNKNPRTTSLIYVKRRRQGRLMTKTSAMIEVPIIEWLEFNASTLIRYLLPHKSCPWSLREKCPNTELFLVCIFLYLDWIRISPYSIQIQENMDQK